MPEFIVEARHSLKSLRDVISGAEDTFAARASIAELQRALESAERDLEKEAKRSNPVSHMASQCSQNALRIQDMERLFGLSKGTIYARVKKA